MCSIVGGFNILTATSSSGFSFLIAADRYYKITIPQPNRFSLGYTLFTDVFIIPLIFGWFCFVAVSLLPLLPNNPFGEDIEGVCAVRKFSEIRIMIMYLLSLKGIFFVALLLSYIYYTRLTKWIKQNQRSTSTEKRKRTVEIMLMMKLIIVVPLVLGTVPMLLSAGQLFLPELPMWIKRVNVVPYLMSNAADPWLTIYSVRPIRHRISQLLCRSKDNATVFAQRTPAVNLADRRQTQMVNHGTRTS